MLSNLILLAFISKAGFAAQRAKGSHRFLRQPDGRTTVVPVHSSKSIGAGVLAKMLRDVDLTGNELEAILS
jgi:predicted RNA binding protein YcfA (HicA-like mRNA interferase family)